MKIKDLPKACPVVNAKHSTTRVYRPRETVKKIADALGVSLDDLMK